MECVRYLGESSTLNPLDDGEVDMLNRLWDVWEEEERVTTVLEVNNERSFKIAGGACGLAWCGAL